MDARARQKETLFNELYQFDKADVEEAETSPLRAFIHQHTLPPVPLTSAANLPRYNPRLSRTVSAPTSVSTVGNTPTPSPVRILPSSIEMSAARPGPGSKSFPAPKSNIKKPKTGSKRKRGRSLDVLPESQKIFKDLSFYFLRNDDVNPARRYRIHKAMERGAIWVKEWRDDVEYVILDSDLRYDHITSFLKIPSLPADVIVVNETYLSDCIEHSILVRPDQPQYHVEGHKEAMVANMPATTSSSDKSLILKPDESAFARGPQTPSRTESEQGSLRQPLGNAEARAVEEQCQIAGRTEAKVARDALDDAIAEAMTVKDLPVELDEDDSFEHDSTHDDSDASHSEDERKSKRSKLKRVSANHSWQQNFNCMQKHDGLESSQNPNRRTIEILQQMAGYYGRINDHWRLTAYRRAIAALRKQNTKIMTKEEAFAIPFIGERLADKIEEIVWTDRLRRLDNAILDPDDEVLQKFLNIYGVGIVQASTWVDQGFRTLDDLTKKAKLTKNQQEGIAHYDDFLARIPREEVELHGKIVRSELSKIDAGLQVTIGGSYRRGAADSGDIDFIITKPDTPLETLRTIFFDTVIAVLFGRKYLRLTLAAAAKESGSKWHGAACVPGSRIWRRVDFLIVPWDEMGAALIYFTGNDIFNRSIRLLASKKGMRLNQRGLWKDVIRGKNRERITQGTLVEGRSEKRIFDILGVPYRPPENRIC